jgi:NAD(P)-dependent dehydrogenase (short-subunit alcohol dehydrogenase family)
MRFDESSTTDDVLAGSKLAGVRAFVTGVSSGLGVETARALVSHGATVVGAARDLGKAEAATGIVRDAARTGGGDFKLIELDLASLDSVRRCSDALQDTAFDILIANAGVMAPPLGHTVDGFETQFGTNHLGHFLLMNRLAPGLRTGARLISLSSSGHGIADIDLDDPNFEHSDYDPWIAYGRSKTANVLFAVEFDRRHRERGVRAAAVHPGVINTELSRYMSEEAITALVARLDSSRAAAGLSPFSYKSTAQGAATTLWAAVRARAEDIGGRYCEDCHVAAVDTTSGVRPYAVDTERAKALWLRSEELIGERF